MSVASLAYRWSASEFLRAWEAGVFDHRVELVDGAGAEPVGTLGSRLEVWDPADVLLVVEISDETMLADLEIKARLYARAGYPIYWVVTRDVVYEHTTPTPRGYHTRNEYRPGEQIPIAYAGTDLPVAELLGQAEPG